MSASVRGGRSVDSVSMSLANSRRSDSVPSDGFDEAGVDAFVVESLVVKTDVLRRCTGNVDSAVVVYEPQYSSSHSSDALEGRRFMGDVDSLLDCVHLVRVGFWKCTSSVQGGRDQPLMNMMCDNDDDVVSCSL